MANRVGIFTAFAPLSPPWSLLQLDANFSAITAFANDSSLGYNNGVPNDTGTSNNYIVTLPYGAPSAYNPGMTVSFIPANTNTGASNLTVSPLVTSLPIVDVFGNALTSGALPAGRMAVVVCTGTAFRLMNSLVTGGVPYYYDYDDFIGAGIQQASTPTANATKLLVGWGSSPTNSAAYNTQVNGHPGIWEVKGSGPSGYGVLAVIATADAITSQGAPGLFLEPQTNVLMRSILNLAALSASNVDITFGLWSLHNAIVSGSHSFLGFVGNAALGSNWLAYSNNAGTITSSSTGIALTVGTWYTLEFTYTALTGTATFYINGAQVATISSNIPISTNLFPGFQVSANAGSTNSQILIDTYEILVNPGVSQRFLYGAI